MTYRKILVPVFGAALDQSALQTAFGLAKQFGAHVEALFVRADPITSVPYGYLAGDPSGFSAGYLIEAAIKAADEAQKGARSGFDKIVDKLHIPVVTKPSAKAEPTASFVVCEGDFLNEVERRSRTSDLIVFVAASGDARPVIREGFEGVLMSGARPALFGPRGATEVSGQRIAIAYDGSAAAAHAVTAAMPFLKQAKELHAFEVTGEKPAALGELQDFLALRGLSAVPHPIDPGTKTAGAALLQAVQEQKCDLLVLGGYGHSRLGEFVFGGVTRHVLQHGAPFAVLMAH